MLTSSQHISITVLQEARVSRGVLPIANHDCFADRRYEPDEIDPTRMDQEENDEDDDEWEQVGSDGEPVKKEEEEPVDYTILSKSLI